MVDFLLMYWKYIVAGVCFLILVILSFVKRTKVVDNSLISKILDLVIDAENKYGPGQGELKLDYVLDQLFKLNPGDYESMEKIYIKLIEYVLSSPQKK